MVWSASEDGTLRQHDFREGTSCPPAGSSHQECRNVLVSGIYNWAFPSWLSSHSHGAWPPYACQVLA